MTLVLALLLVVGATVAYVALRNAQNFSDANEIIPGRATNAPKGWAGSHTPEARLHRRLRDAMTAMRGNSSLDDPAMLEVRLALEDQAVAVDERLIAVAALPKGRRERLLESVAESVDAIEAAVAGLVELRGPTTDDVDRTIADVHRRLEIVRDARAELDQLTRSPDLEALRRELDAETKDEPVAMPDPDAPGARPPAHRDPTSPETSDGDPTS